MGNAQAFNRSLTDQEILVIGQQTGLAPSVIQQLYQAFMERAGIDGRMTLPEFKQCYMEIDPNANVLTSNTDAERIFMLFDIDRNGVLTFNEFMMAYILLQRGSSDPLNRWQSAMSIVPGGMVSRPGYLNPNEALQLLQYMQRFYQLPNFNPSAQQNLLWNQLGSSVDPNGYIAQADVLRMLSSQPQLQPHIF